MNKVDRAELTDLIDKISIITDRIREFADSEQEKYDNLSEGLQASETGEKFQENIDTINEVCDSIADELSRLEEL
jgi:predicted transcriptional regulator